MWQPVGAECTLTDDQQGNDKLSPTTTKNNPINNLNELGSGVPRASSKKQSAFHIPAAFSATLVLSSFPSSIPGLVFPHTIVPTAIARMPHLPPRQSPPHL